MKYAIPLTLILIAVLSSGCGSGKFSNDLSGSPEEPGTEGGTIIHGDTEIPDFGGTGQQIIDARPTFERAAPVGTNPVIETIIRGIGYDDPQTFTVQANRVLKIKISPRQQDRTVPNTGVVPQYAMLAAFIKVGNTERATPLLSNGRVFDQEESDIYDFSNTFDNGCEKNDHHCREEVKITIHKPNYDYWCYTQGLYCPHTWVYFSHPWSLKIFVETDDTVIMDGVPN